MKPTVLTLLILCLIHPGCDKDTVAAVEKIPVPTSLPDIEVDDLRSLVPLELFRTSTKCVFVNENGDSLEMNIGVKEELVEKVIDGIIYRAEDIAFGYIDPQNSSYALSFQATGNYSQNTYTAVKFVQCRSFCPINNGFAATVSIDGHGAPLFIAHQESSITLLNKTFETVYHNYSSPPSIQHFTKVYYSPSLGIVAFSGFDNELWVLESFK